MSAARRTLPSLPFFTEASVSPEAHGALLLNKAGANVGSSLYNDVFKVTELPAHGQNAIFKDL